MEKKEAIREWCVEKAMSYLLSTKAVGFNTNDVIEAARKLEEYVTDKSV